ncbi:MAG TPA: choice-of-anchor D domain-containing protein [Candidatus Barnesiella merdipullorum]|nr:choice-of-anchor D domain-containing protein [Candidatus Barnesiella merdipullorum]
MKKSYLLTCIGVIMSLLGLSPNAHAQSYPYFCGFEDDAENAQWTFVNGNNTNQWCIGTAAKNTGDKGLYISQDGGASSGYDTNSGCTVYAYRTFEVTEPGVYTISFDCNVLGEFSLSGQYDYADVYLAPGDTQFSAGQNENLPMPPSEAISLTNKALIGGMYSWENRSYMQELEVGSYKLAFMFFADSWGGGEGSAAIDNVSISKMASEPNVTIASSLEFPLTSVGGNSIALLNIKNTGGGDLNITDITFSNPDFSLAEAITYPDVIAAMDGDKTYQIKFTPSSSGEITGTMTIHSNTDDITVSLTGTGYTAIEITDDAPIFEDFNELDADEPNMGLGSWTLKNGYATGSTATYWSICTTSAYVCDGKSLQANDARATSTALLISPKLTFAADRSAKISFYMRRASGSSKENEGFKVYVNEVADIYNYDSDGNIVINSNNTVTTLVDPILHAKRYAGSEISLETMYPVEVNIPAEYAGKDFFVIIEAIQEYGNSNAIDNLKIELLPNTPRLENTTESLNLGFVKVGETASKEFTLSNVGTNELEVSFSMDNENSPFSVSPETGTIPFNEQKTFTVSFSNSEIGQFTDNLYIITNGGNDTIPLTAETYPATSYYETFDSSTDLPAEWVIAADGNETTYSIKSNVGEDGSSVLTGAVDYWGSTSSLDTIYSPVVSGKVTFDFKKVYSASSIFKAYIIDATGNKTEIELGASTTNWTPITLEEVPEGSRIAFLISNSYLDNFMAFAHQEITKGVQMMKSSLNRPSTWMTLYAGESKAIDNSIQFTFKNIGTQAIEADSYNFTTQLSNEDGTPVEGVTYKTYISNGDEVVLCEDNVIPGPSLAIGEEKTISGYLLIESEDELNKLKFNVKANNVENTHFSGIETGNNLTIKPNKGAASLSDVEFGMVNKVTTIDYVIKNSSNNGDLTITGITPSEGSGFSVNAELPILIPSSKSDTIQITFDAAPGFHSDSIAVEHNGIGDVKFAVSGTMLTETALLESFEGEAFPPLLWDIKQNEWIRSVGTKYHGEASAVITSATPDTLVTPLLHLAAGDSIAFTAKATSSSGYGTELLYSADGKNWTLLKSIGIYASYWNDWESMAVYMPEDFVEGDYYIGFASKKTYLDLVYGPQVVYQEHRIDIKDFTGVSKGMVNYTQEFTIDVACLGTEGETADSYSIDLMNGEETVGSFQVEAMALGDLKSYTCSWTPHTVGEAQIYALLTLNGTVTSTDTITVNVAEESLVSSVMVGDLSNTTSAPNYKHYLYESLYTPAELTGLQAGDVIETISIPYYVTNAAAKGYRVNIWIGNTEKTELSTSKMSEADIEGLSHIGADLRYEVGGSQVDPLYFEMRPETPITYEGGNLSLIVSVDSTNYCSGINFFTMGVETRSMKYYSFDGSTTANYMDAWTLGTYSPSLRQNVMVISLGLATEAPVVHGIVTRADNQEPIEGATVTMQSGEIIYSTTTDASGAYSITVMQPGKEYEMSVTKDNYTAAEGITITVEEGEDIEQNFELTIITGIDHTAEAAMKIFADRSGNIHIEAGTPIEMVKVYSMSGSLCITESPATESAIINAANLKGVYIVEVQTAGSVKRAKVRL